MHKSIRYFNQNRREIIIIIIILVFAIFLLKVINFSIAKKKSVSEYTVSNVQDATSKYDDSISTYQIATGQNNKTTYSNDIDTISLFIKYCNEGNIQEAYKMLSDECKEAIFPSLEYFKELYINNNFVTNKSYDIQNWSTTTYKVDLKENMLYTGKINENNIQDFITVIKTKDEDKVNVNNYIGKTNINKENTINNINIEVISKNTFMDYEVYKLKIKNDNNFTVFLDDLNTTTSIYLTDENNIKYVAYAHELTKELLKVNPYSSIEIDIKFTNRYIVNRKMEKLIFSEVLLCNENNEKIQVSVKLR